MLMRKILTASLLSLAIVSLLSGAAFAGSNLDIPEATFNFGKVSQHAEVNHTFWIKSTGDDTLKIEKIVPGCGCTQAPIEDSVLAPGDSTAWRITFSTKSFVGYVTKKPYIETNIGPEKKYITIHAELFSEPEKMTPLTLKPFRLDVSQFTTTPRRNASFDIINTTDRDYEITPIDVDGKSFKVELPKKIGAGKTATGSIVVNEDAIETAFQESLTFEINDDGMSRYSLPVKRLFRPRKTE